MVSIHEHGAPPPEDPVHGSREACTDRLHTRGEVLLARGFHDEVRMVGLEGVVQESEATPFAGSPQLRSNSRTNRTVRSDGMSDRTLSVTWHGKRDARGALRR